MKLPTNLVTAIKHVFRRLGHPTPVVVAVTAFLVLAGAGQLRYNAASSGLFSPVSKSGTADKTQSPRSTPVDTANEASQGTQAVDSRSQRPGNPASGAPARLTGPLPFPSYQLVATPSQITLDVNSGTGIVKVASADGTTFPAPVTTAPNNIMVSVPDGGPPPQGGPGKLQASWQLYISTIGKTTAGQGYIEVQAGRGSTRFLVKWLPVPAIETLKGAIVRTDGTDTITYTVNFTVAPNSTVPVAPHSLYLSIYDTSGCINTAELSKSVVYNGGQQNYSLSCTVLRRPVYVPGTGYPPPLNAGGSLSIRVGITVTPASGYFIQSPEPVTFMTPDPYDQ